MYILRSRDSTIKLWSLKQNNCLHTIECEQGPLESLILLSNGNNISNNSTIIASCSFHCVKLWTIRARNFDDEISSTFLKGYDFINYYIMSFVCLTASVSEDGFRFKVCMGLFDGTIHVWNLTKANKMQEHLATFYGHTDSVACIIATDDRRLIISGSYDGN